MSAVCGVSTGAAVNLTTEAPRFLASLRPLIAVPARARRGRGLPLIEDFLRPRPGDPGDFMFLDLGDPWVSSRLPKKSPAFEDFLLKAAGAAGEPVTSFVRGV